MKISEEFVTAYTTLLHAEAAVVSHVMDEDVKLEDLVHAHNVIEDAKNKVVAAYLPYKQSVVQKK